MKATEVKTVIAVDLLTKTIEGIESRLTGVSLKNEIKYHGEALNKSLKAEFDRITGILQEVVDSFYIDSYLVDSYEAMFIENLESAKVQNVSILNSMKKVLRFID